MTNELASGPLASPVKRRALIVRDLGQTEYSEAERLQREAESQALAGGDATLFFVEHPHVITRGRSTAAGHILASEAQLQERGVALHEAGRGGDVTYHGPGQLVGYPVLLLEPERRDAHHYLRDLEEVLIRSLRDFDLVGERVPGMTGVWVDGAKVAALGVRFNRWVTTHGFALNVDPDLSYFKLIVPCGLTGKPVTSLATLLGIAPPMAAVKRVVLRHFLELFG